MALPVTTTQFAAGPMTPVPQQFALSTGRDDLALTLAPSLSNRAYSVTTYAWRPPGASRDTQIRTEDLLLPKQAE